MTRSTRTRRLLAAVLVAGTWLAGCTASPSAEPPPAPPGPAAASGVLATDPLPGMPPVLDPHDIYSGAAAGMLSDAARAAKPLVYVPHTKSGEVWVIDPATFAVVGKYPLGGELQHVVPS